MAPSTGAAYDLNNEFALTGNLKFTNVFAINSVSWAGLNFGAGMLIK